MEARLTNQSPARSDNPFLRRLIYLVTPEDSTPCGFRTTEDDIKYGRALVTTKTFLWMGVAVTVSSLLSQLQ